MNRKDEIKELLKHLLSKAEKVIDKNQYSDDFEMVKKSAKGILDISKEIEKYLTELASDDLTPPNTP